MQNRQNDLLYAGYCEYITDVNPSSKVILARIFLIMFSVFLSVFMLAVTLKTIPVVSFMLLVIIIFMAWFVFQLTKIEYEYIIATGTLELSKIYGTRIRKNLFEIKTSQITCIAPLHLIDKLNIQKENTLWACKKSDSNAVCIVYTENTNKSKMLVISAPQKTITCLKHYRKSVFKDS